MIKGTRPERAWNPRRLEESNVEDSKRPQNSIYLDLDVYDGTSESGGRKRMATSDEDTSSELAASLLTRLPMAPTTENLHIAIKTPRAQTPKYADENQAKSALAPIVVTNTGDLDRAFEWAGPLADFLKVQFQQTGFHKKEGLTLNDSEIVQLSQVLAFALFQGKRRYQAGQTLAAPDRAWTAVVPVTFEVDSDKHGATKVSFFGDRVGTGASKKIRQKRTLRFDPENQTIRSGKAKVQIRAKTPTSDLKEDVLKLQEVLQAMKHMGIETDSHFYAAGNFKNIRTRKEKSEGDEAEAMGSLDITGRNMTPEQNAHLLADVAVTLSKLHQAGYTHGDVKPGNILVKNDKGLLRGFLTDWESLAKDGSPVTTFTKGFRDKNSIGGLQTREGDMYALARCFEKLCATNSNQSVEISRLAQLAQAALMRQDKLSDFFNALLGYYDNRHPR